MPKAYKQLREITTRLERHYKDIQDFEFTIQDNILYMLQTRNGKRTGVAAVHIAVDLVEEGILTQKEAVLKVEPQSLDQLLHPIFDLKARAKAAIAAKGLPASPGAATGAIVFTADDAVAWAGKGKRVVLVRMETVPDDIHGMSVAQGILTATGGMTSHAAVVGRQMGKPSVVGAGSLDIDAKGKKLKVAGRTLKEGDPISIDGSTGEVILAGAAHQPVRGAAGRERDPQGGEVAALPEVREAAGLGGRDPAAGHPRQRRRPARRQGGLRLRRARHRPLPHRAHVLRGGPAAARREDDHVRRARPEGPRPHRAAQGAAGGGEGLAGGRDPQGDGQGREGIRPLHQGLHRTR